MQAERRPYGHFDALARQLTRHYNPEHRTDSEAFGLSCPFIGLRAIHVSDGALCLCTVSLAADHVLLR